MCFSEKGSLLIIFPLILSGPVASPTLTRLIAFHGRMCTSSRPPHPISLPLRGFWHEGTESGPNGLGLSLWATRNQEVLQLRQEMKLIHSETSFETVKSSLSISIKSILTFLQPSRSSSIIHFVCLNSIFIDFNLYSSMRPMFISM